MLEIDRLAVSIIGDLEQSGVHPILLKGPSFATWLYEDRAARLYGDIDLLVGPAQWDAAVAVLGRAGFSDARAGESMVEKPAHALAFVGPTAVSVDLHRSIWGCGVAPPEQWRILIDRTAELELVGRKVRIMDESARTLHVALHAAQHGRAEQKPITDLQRALQMVDERGWRAAAEVAEQLDAVAGLGAGLRLVPDGGRLATELGLPDESSAALQLRLAGGGGAPGMAVARIADAPGLRAKTSHLWHWIFPSRAKMARLSGDDPPGSGGLVLAYLRHLSRWPKAFTAVRVWRAARRSSTPGDEGHDLIDHVDAEPVLPRHVDDPDRR